MSEFAPPGADEKYGLLPVDALDDRAAKLEASDADITKGLHQAQLDRVNQDNGHRRWFVRWVIVIVTGALVASVVIMALYVRSEWRDIEPAVMIAWFSATVVQTLGLAFVVAKYLFPQSPAEN